MAADSTLRIIGGPRSGRRAATLRGIAPLLLVPSLACAGETDGPQSHPPGRPLEIAAAPSLALGVLEGDSLQMFDQVRTPFLLPDGRLVVPLAREGLLRVFDPSGRHVLTLGGRGEGPGEFTSVGSAWSRGDTIEAHDGRLPRLTRFPPGGSPEVVTLTAASVSFDGAVRGFVDEGWLLYGIADAGPGRRDRLVVHHVGRDGAYLGEVARTDGLLRHESEHGSGPTPLSPNAWFALHGGRLYLAEALEAKVRVVAVDGAVEGEMAWTPEPAPAPRDVLARVIDSVVASGHPLYTRARLEAAPVPERLPAFWGFLVDAEGFVWVRRYEPLRHAIPFLGPAWSGGGGEWDVFTPEGAPAGTIRVPPGLEPSQVTSDALVGVHRDALGVESVRVHPLTRAPG